MHNIKYRLMDRRVNDAQRIGVFFLIEDCHNSMRTVSYIDLSAYLESLLTFRLSG